MNGKELLQELILSEGPCGRLCSYCPEDTRLMEIKEAVESLVKENYNLDWGLNRAIHDLIELKQIMKEHGLTEELAEYERRRADEDQNA